MDIVYTIEWFLKSLSLNECEIVNKLLTDQKQCSENQPNPRSLEGPFTICLTYMEIWMWWQVYSHASKGVMALSPWVYETLTILEIYKLADYLSSGMWWVSIYWEYHERKWSNDRNNIKMCKEGKMRGNPDSMWSSNLWEQQSPSLADLLSNNWTECMFFEINRCLKWCYKSATCYIVSLFTMQCVSLKTLLSNYLIQKDNVKEHALFATNVIQLQIVLGCSDLTLA